MILLKEYYLMVVNFLDIYFLFEVIIKVFCVKYKLEEFIFYCKLCNDLICLRCKVIFYENYFIMDFFDVVKGVRELLGLKLLEVKGFFFFLYEYFSDVN